MAEDIGRIVGDNIRQRRMLAGVTLQQLGAVLEVSYQQVQKYEKGTNKIACDKLVVLARFFGCSTDELCGRSSFLRAHL